MENERERAIRQMRQILLDKGLRSPSWMAHSTDEQVIHYCGTWIRALLMSEPVMTLFKWLREEFMVQIEDEQGGGNEAVEAPSAKSHGARGTGG